jgi:hypothetical protein
VEKQTQHGQPKRSIHRGGIFRNDETTAIQQEGNGRIVDDNRTRPDLGHLPHLEESFSKQ